MRISDWSSDVCSSDLVGVRTGQEYLRPARFAAHRQDDRADAVADAHQFARNLLVAADHALGAAEVDDDVAELDRLDDAGDDLARAVLIFLIRSEEHPSELPSLMRISYAVFCLKKKNKPQ